MTTENVRWVAWLRCAERGTCADEASARTVAQALGWTLVGPVDGDDEDDALWAVELPAADQAACLADDQWLERGDDVSPAGHFGLVFRRLTLS